MARGSRILAGLGGPARYFARRYGALVTGVDLRQRVSGADELTQLVGLHEQVQIVEGNVMAAPIPDKSVDVVIEPRRLSFTFPIGGGRWPRRSAYSARRPPRLHRLGRAGALAKTRRGPSVGRPGRPGAGKPQILSGLIDGHWFSRPRLRRLTVQWAVLLKARLAMYQKLRLEAEAAGTPPGMTPSRDPMSSSLTSWARMFSAASGSSPRGR